MADEKKTLNVVVTGGAEGAGLAVVKALVHKGYQVTATTASSNGALTIRSVGALPVYPDLTREGEVLSTLLMANADIVVHAAPQILGGVPQADVNYASKAKWLVDSTNAVVSAAGKNEVNKIISISFGYLYDGHHGTASNESAHTVHDANYNAMLDAEAAVIDGGVDGYVIRVGYIYGGNSSGTTWVADAIRDNHPLRMGEHLASWIHEDDLAVAIVALIEAESDGDTLAEIINVADDHPISPNDFAQELGNTLGLSNIDFASSGWRAILRGETLRDTLLAREINLDTHKIKEKYGWQPQYATITAGLETTAMTWRMLDATDASTLYDYVDVASEAIAALESGQGLALPEEVEEEAPVEEAVVEKKAPPKPSAPPPSDGPTPWNEGEDKMEERRLKALERKKRRAEKRAAQGG